MIEQEFWHGKKVLVTGNTGFKGGWLSLWLQKMGAEVMGFSLDPPTNPSLFEVAKVNSGMTTIISDIREFSNVYNVIENFKPQVVFHMAAQPLVRQSYINPIETYETNVMGTVHVLEAVRRSESVKSAVIITSDKCYENKEWHWGYRECEPMGGFDPYSNSKGCSELVVSAYRNSFFNEGRTESGGCSIASVRAGNVIGGGDWADDRLIPDMLKSFQEGESVFIRYPNAIRPWQHVLEPLAGYLEVAQSLYRNEGGFSGGWNFGPDDSDARPVQWVVERMVELWGAGASWSFDDREHPHEAKYLKLDCSKAKSLTDWEPRWHLETALDKIIKWHKAWIAGHDMREYSIEEIDSYISKIK